MKLAAETAKVHAGETFGRRNVPELNQASGIAEGEWAEEHGVYDAEDGGVCSDAQGQDDDGGCGEAGVLQQDTEAVFEIR